MFLENKYAKWYFSIIEKAKNRKIEADFERHHIVPVSLGGSKSRKNTVKLTYKEHFLCHWLLTKMTKGNARHKMKFALAHLTRTNKNMRVVSGWQYVIGRKAQREIMSEKMKGNQIRKGVPLTEKHKEKIRLSNLGKKRSETTKENIRKATTGKKQSQETIEKRLKSMEKIRWKYNTPEVIEKKRRAAIKQHKRKRALLMQNPAMKYHEIRDSVN